MLENSGHKLDNPAWYALAEMHSHFSINDGNLKRYQPGIVAFAAFDHADNSFNPSASGGFFSPGESFFIIGELPRLPMGYTIESILPCAQMICQSKIDMRVTDVIEKLDAGDNDEMTALINLVQPGYYKPGTRLMGDYVGIRQDGRLVAIAGERMKMNDFSEVSAVVTHPDFTGRKYAQQLVAYIVNKNITAGKIPFLHVAETNQRAISIYEYLGFRKRRIINFTKIKAPA